MRRLVGPWEGASGNPQLVYAADLKHASSDQQVLNNLGLTMRSCLAVAMLSAVSTCCSGTTSDSSSVQQHA